MLDNLHIFLDYRGLQGAEGECCTLVYNCWFSLYNKALYNKCWRMSCENCAVQGLKNWQFFDLRKWVTFFLFELLSPIWYQNNQKFDHLSGDNPSFWYTWQHLHHGRICATLFWTLNRSIFQQHSSTVTCIEQSMLYIQLCWKLECTTPLSYNHGLF